MNVALTLTTGVVIVGVSERTTVEPEPVVVAAPIAVPSPASTGALMVVESVRVGLTGLPSDDPAKPLSVATATVWTLLLPNAAAAFAGKSSQMPLGPAPQLTLLLPLLDA